MLPADSYSSKSTVAEVGKSSVKAICPEECIGTKANKGQDTAQPRDEAGGVPVGGEAAHLRSPAQLPPSVRRVEACLCNRFRSARFLGHDLADV